MSRILSCFLEREWKRKIQWSQCIDVYLIEIFFSNRLNMCYLNIFGVSTRDFLATSRKLHAMCCWSQRWMFLRCAFVILTMGISCAAYSFNSNILIVIETLIMEEFLLSVESKVAQNRHGISGTCLKQQMRLFPFQLIRLSASRSFPDPSAFSRAQVSHARMRWFWTRDRQLLVSQEFIGLPTC